VARARRLIIAVILLGAAAGGAVWYFNGKEAPVSALTLYGNVDIRQVELAFAVSERIKTMDVNEGERVSGGQLLATLDDRRFTQRVAQARAQLAAQQQVVAALVAGSRPQEIRKARADVEAAKADAGNAARIAHRQANLLKRGLTSAEQAEDARSGADAAAARLRAAKAALALALEGPRQEDIDSAKAQLRALQAQLALDQTDLADSRLVAPVDAVVENRILEPGDMASPQTPAYTLALDDPLWVRAYVSERHLGKLHPGMAARVTTDSFPGKVYKAWVGYISPTAEFTPKSVETPDVRTNLVYQVRVYVCNPRNELRQGMPATVTLSPEDTSAPGCGGDGGAPSGSQAASGP